MKRPKPPKDPLDRYYTPPACAAAIVDRFVLPGDRALDPCVGRLAPFANAARDIGCDVVTVDLDDEAEADWQGFDFLRLGVEDLGEFDVVIGNPPFTLAEAFVRHGLIFAPRVVFLLRGSFVGSRKRLGFFAEIPVRDRLTLVPRPAFSTHEAEADGTDVGTEYEALEFLRKGDLPGRPAEVSAVRHLVWRASK